jgi:hypothetical protein
MALPECFTYHSEADNYREHCEHEFNAQFDRYDGWGDKEAQMEDYYDDFFGNNGAGRISLPVIDPTYVPCTDEDVPF